MLLRSGDLTVTRSYIQVSGRVIPLSSISSINYGQSANFNWWPLVAAMLFCAAAIVAICWWPVFSEGLAQFRGWRMIPNDSRASAGFQQACLSFLLFPFAGIAAWAGKVSSGRAKAFKDQITYSIMFALHSGDWQSVSFLSRAELQRCATALVDAISSGGHSTVINALQINN